MHERGRNKLMAMVTTVVNGLSAIEDLLPAVQGRTPRRPKRRETVGAHGVRPCFSTDCANLSRRLPFMRASLSRRG
jgi:hypothetical protein